MVGNKIGTSADGTAAIPNTYGITFSDGFSGGANLNGGTGLRGLADRVEALGGELRLHSHAGDGTVIRAALPLH